MASKDQNPKWAAHQQLRAKRSEVVEAPKSTPKVTKVEVVQIPVEEPETPVEVKTEVPTEVTEEVPNAVEEKVQDDPIQEDEKPELKPISKKKNKA